MTQIHANQFFVILISSLQMSETNSGRPSLTDEDLKGQNPSRWFSKSLTKSSTSGTLGSHQLKLTEVASQQVDQHDKPLMVLIVSTPLAFCVFLFFHIILPHSKSNLMTTFQKQLSDAFSLPTNTGVVASYVMFTWDLAMHTYMCLSVFRRNLAGGLVYLMPGYLNKKFCLSCIASYLFLVMWVRLVAEARLAWAFVTVIAIVGTSSCSVMLALKEFQDKEKECPDFVTDREKLVFFLVVINGTAFAAARLGGTFLKTFILFLLGELGLEDDTNLAYAFLTMLLFLVVNSGLTELLLFRQRLNFVFSHHLVWTSYPLSIAIASYSKNISTFQRVYPCLITITAFLFASIKIGLIAHAVINRNDGIGVIKKRFKN